MLRDERLQDILEVLRLQGFATGKELSRKFYTSLSTMYRDLRELERQGLIARSGGGAVPVKEGKAHPPLNLRQIANMESKSAIAQRAARLLSPGDTVFLDASSTAASMTAFLRADMGLTVLTNGLMTAVQLQNAGIRTFCVGGRLIDNSVAVGGKLAVDTVERFRLDKLFFSAYGVDAGGTIVDMSEAESVFRRRLLRKPLTSVFLCDASKFNRHSVFTVASMESVDYLVTDAMPPEGLPAPRKKVLLA